MKSYPGNLSLDLRKYRDSAWDYVAKRWPGAELIPSQGVGGWAFYLPGKRVLKITDHVGELKTARRVRREKPRGVVPVLSVGSDYYIMPRLRPRRGYESGYPDAPGVTHWDGHGGNMMRCPKTRQLLWIDLDGVVFDRRAA